MNENILKNVNERLSNKPAYKKMLNNLLGIGSIDNSTFTSSKINNLDLKSLLSAVDFNKIFNNHSFKVEISNMNSEIMLSDLITSESMEEFIEIINENGSVITMTDRKLLSKSFEEAKEKIITKFKKNKNQTISKWKKVKNRYLDKQAQTNSWPLYVGSMFVKVKTVSSVLYAPLILKKVEIDITNNNKVYIKSIDDSVEMNEKLLFLLQNEYKINLPKIKDEGKYSINQVLDIYSNILSTIINPNFFFENAYEHFTKAEINNLDLQYATGAILTISSPSGGDLRDKLINFILEGDPDDLLDIDVIKDLKREINVELEEGKSIFRITETDLSQEKAIIGSLKDNSIIWGPPGTGKSQTISNIIANLLATNKTAIITSEKKAALDVIQKRMGKISKFMFFGLIDKNVDKEAFYKPFQELINSIMESRYVEKYIPKSSITDAERELLKQKQKLNNEEIDILISIHKKTNDYNFTHILKDIHAFLKERPQLVLNMSNSPESIEILLGENGIKKKRFKLRGYTKEVRNFIDCFKNSGEDFRYFIELSQIKNFKNVEKFDNFIKTEKRYVLDRLKFKNDEDYLEALLSNRFKERMMKLETNAAYRKKLRTFRKNCVSGFRIPYKFVNSHKQVITDLFDIFVSTPQTLAGTIDMDFEYDYAIFDEASQLHLEKSIPFISMANISIIAGDHMQMRPTSYFEVRDTTDILEDSEANVDSLLDFAYRKGLKSREYMLTKNYRSKISDLMMFSSKEFYEGKLDVIDNKKNIGQEAIEVIDVNGKWEGRVNEKEAQAVLDRLLIEKNNYKKIILLTLNSTQKQLIEAEIYNNGKYNPIIILLEEEKVLLRNLENIQGDEADLVIISVAYDKSAKLSATYVGKPIGKNALNVAISRAMEKMIVFKSINSNEVSGNVNNNSVKVFRKWLSYLELSSEDKKNYIIKSNKQFKQFDSIFKEHVYHDVVKYISFSRKILIKKQYNIGSYSIDIALIDSETGKFILGIEIDGYKHHSEFVKMTKNIERQRFIETKEYPIYRITELNWKINTQRVLEEIKKLIYKIMLF